MKTKLLFGALLIGSLATAQSPTNVFSYGFDSDFPSTWVKTNQSSPSTSTVWNKASFTLPLTAPIFGSGNVNTVPVGQEGGDNSFALVNYTSTTGNNIISNWLITESINVKDGDIVSFYTRKGTDGTTDYADRLEMRYSTAPTHVTPTGGASGLGTFTNLGVSVNPNLAGGFVYPKTWTKYTFSVTGVGNLEVPTKFAFRYFVTSGGPTGANSDIIGIDTFSVDRPGLAVSDINKAKSSIYPNPAKDVLNIRSTSKIIKAEIFDVSGRVIKTIDTENVNVADLKKGMYLIKIYTNNGETVEKFIKE